MYVFGTILPLDKDFGKCYNTDMNCGIEINKVYNIDCSLLMDKIKEQSINLIITSPPYNLILPKGENWKIKSWYKDDLSEENYQKWQREKMLGISRVVCYNHKVRNKNLTAIHPMSWIPSQYLYQEIIWDRNITPQVSKKYFLPVDERIYILAKNRKDIMLNQKLKTVWRIRPRQNVGFPNAFPFELVENLVRAFTREGDIVFDPFVGSGTTVLQAYKMKRNYLGCEVVEEYATKLQNVMKGLEIGA